ncbi:MAG: hypothetical protein ACYC5N_06235 [Endomicrobiales bacterium]
MKKLFLASCCVMLLSGVSFARNGAPRKATTPKGTPAVQQTEGAIGVGFNSQLSRRGLESLALRAWLSDTLGIEGILGFAFGDGESFFDLGGKVLGVIRKEQNLSLYGFGLLGIENSSIKNPVTGDTASETSVAFGGGLGVEFFLQGLPNLGFGTEIGLGYNSGSKQFGTLADWITSVGMRYYF